MPKAVRYDEFGGIDVLRVDEVERPVPGVGQVLVRVKAAGINPSEAVIRVLFLDGPATRNALLLRDLPATADVLSWDAYDLMKVFPAGFTWSGGLLTTQQLDALNPYPRDPAQAPEIQPADEALIDQLTINACAGYSELAAVLGTSASTVSRRLELLLSAHMVRLACEVDLRLLGIASEALLWIATGPGSLETTGRTLSAHPQVRFTAATTGPANLLVAVAAKDLSGLYAFITDTVGSLGDIRGLELTPILNSVKRTGRIRLSDPLTPPDPQRTRAGRNIAGPRPEHGRSSSRGSAAEPGA